MKKIKSYSTLNSILILLLFLSLFSIILFTSASTDGIGSNDTDAELVVTSSNDGATNSEENVVAPPAEEKNNDEVIVNEVEWVETRKLLDIADFSDLSVGGIKARKPSSPIVKISALGFWLIDIWSQLPVNDSKGAQYDIGIFGVSASLDIFPTRNFWFLGVEYDWITTAYHTNLHIALIEGGYMFRPVKNLYLTPSIGAGIILGSRSFLTDLPKIGWSMSIGFAITYEIIEGFSVELEPKVFIGSEKHNPFSFVPLTVGFSYAY